MELTTSYKFKLLPTEEQRNFLQDYFLRFGKAVNFAAKKYLLVEKSQQATYEFIKEGIEGICSYCRNSYKSCSEHKPEGKNFRDRNKICKTCKQKSLLNRRKKSGKEFVCQKCWNSEFSIRKILYATRGRKRSKFGDIKDAAKLPGTEYALAFKRADDTLKALKKQQSRIKRTIGYLERKLQEWKDVIENKIVTLNDGKKVSARYILPRKIGQKVDRFKHIFRKDDENQKGKTESRINQEIKSSMKTIEKLNKRLKELKIQFGGSIVDLQNSSVKNINDKFVELSIDGRREKFVIAIENVHSDKSKKWLLEVIQRIRNGEPRYPLLLRKSDSFYLSYPIRHELEPPKVEPGAKLIGIDRGVNQIAVMAVIDKPKGNPNHIKFYSGKELMGLKNKYQLISKKFTGTKSVNKRRTEFGRKVSRISDYLIHNISRTIVNQAKELKPSVIVMEDLKLIQGEKRAKRTTVKKEKKINYMLSNFLYGKLQKLIEYKSLQAGIPVRYVDPRNTSRTCYKCGSIDERNRKSQSFFKCISCGHKMHADLNAAINIANSLYKEIKP